jgi:phosphate transport system substrate-binding protein
LKRFIPLALIVPLAIAGCSSSSKSNSSTSTNGGSPATTASSPGSGGAANMNTGNPSSAQTVTEAGSSLLFPFLQAIAPGIHETYSNITLNPAAGGSGAGINDVIAGTVNLGGSDAYLSPSEFAANPGLMNIPIVVSSQSVDYNLAGIKNLKLSGDVLAKIYQGTITTWNDQAIAALNPGVTLPATKIVPVRRADSSGDTFLFTSYLSATNSQWANSPGYNTKITWPTVANEQTATGNPGMVQVCKSTPGCVAYIGISAQSTADAAGLGQSMLQNKAGTFLLPTTATVLSAVNAGAANVPANLAVSLIYQPGANSYPIVNFEYLVVKKSQSSADLAKAIRTVFAYSIDDTQGSSPANLQKQQFEALPASILPAVQSAVASIQ